MQWTKTEVFDIILKQIDSLHILDKDVSMIHKRINNPTVSEWLSRIKFDKKISVIELGCSIGHLPISELLFGNLKINSWIGYDCDKIAIKTANVLSQKFNLNSKCKFFHSAVSSYKNKYVYYTDSALLGAQVYKTKKDSFTNKTPNLHYKNLPACDLLLVDIEGEEFNIDFNQMQYTYCIIETNTVQATNKFIKNYMSNTNNFKILQNFKLRKDKNTFLIVKNN